MVQKRKLKKLKRQSNDSRKSLIALLLVLGLLTTMYLSVNSRSFSVFLSGGEVPFTGDISFMGMSVEDEEKRLSEPVGQFTNNFDGVPVWTDYSSGYPIPDTVGKYTDDYPNLVGCPKMLPQTSWSFSAINHIDMDIDNPQIIEEDTSPSSFQVTDGYYTETYRYSTDIFVRVHAKADMDFLPANTYNLEFTSGQFTTTKTRVISRYLGEYAPMYEVYSKIGISIDAVNESIVETGADMAANGDLEVRFWPWDETPNWEHDRSYDLVDAYQYILDKLHGGAIINNDVMQTGFDRAQGFNIIDKVEGANSYYEFNVGFNFLGVPGCFYDYYDFLIFGWHQGLVLLDMEIKIPVTFQIVVSYDIEADSMDDLFDIYPELKIPGATVKIIGTSAIPTNSTYGDYFPDNRVIGVFESLPGFSWLEGEFGTMAFVIVAVLIGFGIAMLFKKRGG